MGKVNSSSYSIVLFVSIGGIWRFGVDKKDFNVDHQYLELRFSNREEATSSIACSFACLILVIISLRRVLNLNQSYR